MIRRVDAWRPPDPRVEAWTRESPAEPWRWLGTWPSREAMYENRLVASFLHLRVTRFGFEPAGPYAWEERPRGMTAAEIIASWCDPPPVAVVPVLDWSDARPLVPPIDWSETRPIGGPVPVFPFPPIRPTRRPSRG